MSSSAPERQRTLNSHFQSQFEVVLLSGLMAEGSSQNRN